MLRTGIFYKIICCVISLCIILIVIGSRFENNEHGRALYEIPKSPEVHVHTLNIYYVKDKEFRDHIRLQPTNIPLATEDTNGSPNIEEILNATRSNILRELWNYNFTHSRVQRLEDLVMETGGNPVRNVIVTSWRSGSTFLGDLINSAPSNFALFEPLAHNFLQQIRGPPDADKALAIITNMLKCEYDSEKVADYFKRWQYQTTLIRQNRRFWDQCVKYKEKLCYDPIFTAKMCKLFPFQSMKIVQLRLGLANAILEDTDFNVNVVFLVRDPRGVMQSRLHLPEFCLVNPTEMERKQNRKPLPSPDCSNPQLVCADMVSDYIAAKRLSQEYPRRIMVLRFEDLVLNLTTIAPELANFLRLDAIAAFNEFIQTHSNVQDTEEFSLFKVSREVPFKWKKALDFNRVEDIQEACRTAMKLWGYKNANNASHMASNEFYPLGSYRLQ